MTCGWGFLGSAARLGDPGRHPVLVVVCFPWSTSRLCPSPQSLPVETLGPESGVGPELQSAPQAPRSPYEADSEELAGTSDGAGNRALPGAGRRHPPSAFWGPRRPQARAVPVHFPLPLPASSCPFRAGGARGSPKAVWEARRGQRWFSSALPPITETIFPSASAQPDAALPDEAEVKVRTVTWGGKEVGRAASCSRLCLQQDVPEGAGRGMASPGPGDTVAQGDLEETPVLADLAPDTQDLEGQSPQQSLPSSTSAGESPPRPPLSPSF